MNGSATTAYFEGVGSITVAGPFNVQGPGETPAARRFSSAVRPRRSRARRRARERSCPTSRTAPIGVRSATATLPQLLDALQGRAQQNGGFEAGIRLALQKILVSPDFLFRAEHDPPGAAPGSVHRVSDVELASRLSFFLWSSIPDDQLLAVAGAGGCPTRAVLQAQVKRMLADPRSQALVKNFAGQWLFLRNIARITPDTASFPNFDENLRHALAKETELLIESSVREDASVADLLDTDYTFLNRAPGRALRDQGHLRQRVPPRQARRPEPARPARTGAASWR